MTVLHRLSTFTTAPKDTTAFQAEAQGATARPGFLGAWNLMFGPLNRTLVLDTVERADDPLPEPAGAVAPTARESRLLSAEKPFEAAAWARFYDFRMYTIRPGCGRQYIELMLAALPIRQRYSLNAGLWTPLSGPADQIIHLWPYTDLAQRERAIAGVKQDPDYQSFIAAALPMIHSMEALMLTPLSNG